MASKILRAGHVQKSVVSPVGSHALFLTLCLRADFDLPGSIHSLAKISAAVASIEQEYKSEVHHGIGLSPGFCEKVGISERFGYESRICGDVTMPATDGDIFLHAKHDDHGILFELCANVVKEFAGGDLEKFEDVYGFRYRRNRDISGFVDGINNPSEEKDRLEVGVRCDGGSFCVTQRWVHDLAVINGEKDAQLEQWIGRDRKEGAELLEKSVTCHVARMKGGNAFAQKPKFRLVRQSMPYGRLCADSGLFFIGYNKTIEAMDFMLGELMQQQRGQSDDILRISRPVTGNYWYFPSLEQLSAIVGGGGTD